MFSVLADSRRLTKSTEFFPLFKAIPFYVSPASQYTMKAFVAGVWVLYTMDIGEHSLRKYIFTSLSSST